MKRRILHLDPIEYLRRRSGQTLEDVHSILAEVPAESTLADALERTFVV